MRDVRLFDVSRDPRERPIFNVTEAADYVGVPRSTPPLDQASEERPRSDRDSKRQAVFP